jgi:uncharacterized membrane protein
MKVTKSRSLVKAFSYRVFGTLTSWAVVFVITGEGTLAVIIALWETVIKVVVYYWHERVWNFISWGRKK